MSRRLLNDPALNATIQVEFVPVSGAIENLQPARYGNPENAASEWFQPVARKALEQFAPKEWWEKFKTYQGLYVLGPDGKAYHYQVVWELDPGDYLETLEKALAEYRAKPPKKVEIPETLVADTEPERAAAATSVLRVLSRVAVPPAPGTKAHQGVGRDHMWIYQNEVREMLGTSLEPGVSGPLPRSMVARLVRFQLLDHSRNVSQGFEDADVSKADFSMRLLSVGETTRTFAFTGEYASRRRPDDGGGGGEGDGEGDGDDTGEYGVEGTLRGEFEIDAARARITRFRAHGKARAWGQLANGAPKGRYPIEFALVDVDPNDPRVVAPLFATIHPGLRIVYRNPQLAIQADE